MNPLEALLENETTHSIINECIICGGTDTQPLYTTVAKCRKCGHVFCNRRLTDQQLSDLYGTSYFSGAEYSNYLTDKPVLQKNFRLRLNVLKKFLDPHRHRHLLEVGCAYGFFLEIARPHFETVFGIDITEEGVGYAADTLKLNAVNADLLKYDLGDRKFDVVCMWDTIEHLCDPHLYLEKISRHTESGALLALTTGDIKSLNARVRKDKWRLMHPPTHMHFFSRETLVRLLDSYGFDLIYDRYCGFYRSLDNIVYITFVLRKKHPGLYSFLRKIKLTKINFYLNLYDIMYVIARRR